MRPFAERYRAALGDPNVGPALLGFQRSWREGRDEQMRELEADRGESFETMRRRLAAAKDVVIAERERFLDAFTRQAEDAGTHVVTCATAAEANAYLADLCASRGTRLVVKGKSMVSEEIGMNDALADRGISAIETDLGEWLLQLAHDHPSHLVMPAIHKRRQECAQILEQATGRAFDPDDIPAMVRAARTELRDAFLTAGVGVCGANALIAESGSVMVITNEGNNCLTTSLPPVTVVVAGAEKLLPTFADAMLQLRLLARSATGQTITTYTTFLSGPTGATDAARAHELHVLLIDNGRSLLADDPHLIEALRCIRCGACANVCPPYQVVGGHAFGHVYTGAIGLVDTPFHHGWDNAAGPQSLCVSCGACATVCPVDIPLPDQILEIRHGVAENVGLPIGRRLALRALASRPLTAAIARVTAVLLAPARRGAVTRLPLPTRFAWRTPPAVPFAPARSHPELRDTPLDAPAADTDISGTTVALFLQCIGDRLLPEIPVATARLLRAAGARVVVPPRQHCCGLPAFDSGDWETARRMARDTIDALEGYDTIVTPAPSCAIAMTHHYERLFEDDPGYAARARSLAARVHDLVDLLRHEARLPAGACAADGASPALTTIHRFCQSGNVLHQEGEMEALVQSLTGIETVPLAECGTCCGFGGTTSLTAPDVVAGILDRKLSCVDESGASVLVTDNPGCILHLRGGIDASDRRVEVRHLAEFLADGLPRDPSP